MFAKNADGTIKYLSVVTKPAADTPRNPYATGYGAKIPSATLALVGDKWQRVYVTCYSNSGTAWVQVKGERVCIVEREAETPREHYATDRNFFNFVNGYVNCLKWSTTGDFKGLELESLEGRKFHPATYAAALVDCLAFYTANKSDCAEAAARFDCITDRGGYGSVGHDFWLTRAGHGAGFWDGDLPKDLGDRLTEASKLVGEVEPYLGDDGLIYIGGSEPSAYTALEVDGEPYEYDADSVCFKRDDGDFEFWFYHRQGQPTAEVIAMLIRAANADQGAKQ